MTYAEKIKILRQVSSELEKAVESFCGVLDAPQLVPDGDEMFPRFENPTPRHFQILMAVRVVSGINASCSLLESGYVQEVGVILRTLEEFLAKIILIQNMYEENKVTSEQQKLIDEYFKVDIRRAEDILDGPTWWANMRRVYAEYAKYLTKAPNTPNPEELQRKARTIYNGFSGYVHGFYSHIMEIYESGTERFRMQGVPNTVRVREMLCSGGLPAYAHRSLNIFASIAQGLQLFELFQRLIECRRNFEKSSAYSN